MKKKCLALLMSLALVVSLFPGVSGLASGGDSVINNQQEVPAVTADGMQNPDAPVRLMVELDDAPALELKEARMQGARRFAGTSTAKNYRKTLRQKQAAVQERILDVAPSAVFKYGYTNLMNGFAVTVPAAEVEAVKSVDGVKEVYLAGGFKAPTDDTQAEENLNKLLEELNSDPAMDPNMVVQADPSTIDMTGVEAAWDLGYTGGGKVIAMFDTGLLYTHEAMSTIKPFPNQLTKADLTQKILDNQATLNMFSNGWFRKDKGAGNGFSAAMQTRIKNGDFFISAKVPLGINYADCNLTVWSAGVSDSAHGMHTSGIAAAGWNKPGIEPPVKGMASDAQVLCYRIFSTTDTWGYDEDIMAALDDAATIGADAFNLSIGDTSGFSSYEGDARLFGFERAFDRAKTAGCNVAVSSGNSGFIRTGSLSNSNSFAKYPDNATVGTPGAGNNVLCVASIQNLKMFGTVLDYGFYVDGERDMFYYRDSNTQGIAGRTAFNNVPVGLVNCGSGATPDAFPDGVSGRIALMSRGESDAALIKQQQNAFNKGAVACIIYGGSSGIPPFIGGATQLYDSALLPTIAVPQSDGERLIALVGANQDVKVRFKDGQRMAYGTNYPITPGQVVANSSWGPTPDLQLKPDISAPGSYILSLANNNPTAYVNMSGTSMAAPHVAGAYLLVQQYVEANYPSYTGGAKARLVEQMLQSSAVLVPFYNTSTQINGTRYLQSPRWQGAGAMNLDMLLKNKVILYNTYNQKTKVELGDNLADTFAFQFNVQNLGTTAQTYDVWGYNQTDSATQSVPATISSTTRAIQSVMTVKSVAGGATLDADSANINRYGSESGRAPAKITVPASTTATVTVQVKLPDMTEFTKDFVNGLFVEGFIELAGSDVPTVSLPFMGFYDSWLKAPAIDPYSIYDTVTSSDPNYPLYYENSLRTHNSADGQDFILGRNEFATPTTLPQEGDIYGLLRNTANTLRLAGCLKRSFISFSPNGDGYFDNVYAHINMLRGVKSLTVTIENAEGQTVRTVGTKMFTRKQDKDNNGQNFFTNLYKEGLLWNGKDDAQNDLPEGAYTYKLTGISDFAGAEARPHIWSLPVVIDNTKPVMTGAGLSFSGDQAWFDFSLSDNHMLQAYEVYYGPTRIAGPVLVNAPTGSGHVNISGLVSQEDFSMAGLRVRALDYAHNVAQLQSFRLEPGTAELAVGKTFTVTPSMPGNFNWASENPGIVTVAGGVLTGVSAGETIVTASMGGMSATCSVKVFDISDLLAMVAQAETLKENLYRADTWTAMRQALPAALAIRDNPVTPTKDAYVAARDALKAGLDGLVLKITSLKTNLPVIVSVKRGRTQQIGLVSAPTPADKVAFIWSAINTSVATVSDTGLVTGVKAGLCAITVRAQDGSGLTTQIMISVVS